jgi:Cys-tRNA(Pro)/Cys-tRNA(Cys) deacylase
MSSTTPATKFLEKAGVAFTLHHYDHDPEADRIGRRARLARGGESNDVPLN